MREPLVHFLLASGLVFALHGWLGAAPKDSDTVRLSAPLVSAVRSEFLGREGRAPSRAEEDTLLKEFAQDEVLYREGLRRNLDKADIIVRRRVIQKMEFLLESFAEPDSPSRADLEAYLASHPDAFRVPARTSFIQIFFDRRRRGEEAPKDAAEVLSRIEAGTEKTDPSLGDPFLQGYVFESRSPTDIARLFGEDFARAIATADEGSWVGPLATPLGAHLVWVSGRTPAQMPALEDVLPAVREAWRSQQIESRQEELLAQLVAGYEVEIERPALEVAEVRP